MRSILGMGVVSAVLLMLPLAHAAQNVFQDPLDVAAGESVAASKQMLVAGRQTPGGRLVAVGRRGLIITSEDNGASWKQSVVPVSTDLVAVDFPTSEQGWAVGHSGVVLHTSDGGLKWERQLDGRALPDLLIARFKPGADAGNESAQRELKEAEQNKKDGPSRPLFDVRFKDPLHGMLVGAYNLALRTEDGGRSWIPIGDLIENPQGSHLYAIAQVDDALWIAGEQGLVLKQDLSNGRFVRVPLPYEGTLFGITGRSGEVIVFGLRGNALRSRDGGVSWKKLDTGTLNHLTSAAIMADGRLFLTTLAGELLVVPEGEDKAKMLRLDRPQQLYSASGSGDGKLLLLGENGVRIESVGSISLAGDKFPTATSPPAGKDVAPQTN